MIWRRTRRALVLLGGVVIAACAGDVAPRPPEIRRTEVAGDHLHVDVLVTDAADPSDLVPAIVASVKEVRRRLAAGSVAGGGDVRTVTIDARFVPYGSQGEQPLATVDYDRSALERATDSMPAADLLELARAARTRPPLGDLRIRAECEAAPAALRVSALCVDAGG